MIVVLLGVRNRAEAKRKENELKEAAEKEGRSTEGIEVKEGEVDWLYGSKSEEQSADGQPASNEKSDLDDLSNDVEVVDKVSYIFFTVKCFSSQI